MPDISCDQNSIETDYVYAYTISQISIYLKRMVVLQLYCIVLIVEKNVSILSKYSKTLLHVNQVPIFFFRNLKCCLIDDECFWNR